jgi:DNA invertase Pin-like site-specific DNA recombinase
MAGREGALRELREYREVTADRDRRIRAAKLAGLNVSEISRAAGVSRPTVYEALGETPDANARAFAQEGAFPDIVAGHGHIKPDNN